MQKNKFNQSIEDINDFFSLLEFIDSIETYKNIMLPNPTTTSSLLVTSTQQKCMRSHAVLMLYNIVEATVVECILAIFDAIKDDHLKYHELEDSLREQWLRSMMTTGDSIKTRIARTKEISIHKQFATFLCGYSNHITFLLLSCRRSLAG